MSMMTHIQTALHKYGNTVKVVRDGRTEVTKAFVQPLRRRHRPYINDKFVPQGYFDNAYKLYIGDTAHPLSSSDGTVVICNGVKYTVVIAEEFVVADESIYLWAILLPKNNAKESDYDCLDRQ